MKVGVVVLAAGNSRRFGSDKRLAPLPEGGSLLLTSVGNALASGLAVTVCLRPGEADLGAAVELQGAAALYCSDAAAGMGHTLAQAVAALEPLDGILVALGDMPRIQPATYLAVARSLQPGTICQPVWSGQCGHPVGFGQDWFAALRELRGDSGARSLVGANPQCHIRVAVSDPGILEDIDRPGDLR